MPLSEYSLGVINKQEAFAYHGGPVRKLTLPNGNMGWLYSTAEAINQLHKAGLDVVMLTGDSKTTAHAVASKLNID